MYSFNVGMVSNCFLVLESNLNFKITLKIFSRLKKKTVAAIDGVVFGVDGRD